VCISIPCFVYYPIGKGGGLFGHSQHKFRTGRGRPIPSELEIAGRSIPGSRLVSRCEVRHLGALVSTMRAGAWRLVRTKMYIEGDDDYKLQIAHFGHSSKMGFKGIDHMWHAGVVKVAMMLLAELVALASPL